jgi:hypothetical protein
MPEIWFTDFANGSRILVKHHVQEQEVNGHFLFDDDWFAQCWLSSADLGMDRAYSLNIQGSERSYQAVDSGPCLPAHPMFYEQQQGPELSAATAAAAGPFAGSTAAGQGGDCRGCHHPCHTAIWTAPVQMEVASTSTFAYVVRQHLDYHMRIGMSGMWMMCDRFVCLELLRDSLLAARAAEGRLVLWSWVSMEGAVTSMFCTWWLIMMMVALLLTPGEVGGCTSACLQHGSTWCLGDHG